MSNHKTALLTVDLQLSRVPGAYPGESREGAATFDALNAYMRMFREAGKPIIHAVGGAGILQATLADEVIDARLLPKPGGDGASAADARPAYGGSGLRIYGDYLARGFFQRLGPNEVVMHKSGWGAFYRTPLEAYLRGLGVETLWVAGCRFPAGPRATLYEATERKFTTGLLEDAVSGMYALARSEILRLGVGLQNRAPRTPAARGFRRRPRLLAQLAPARRD